MGKGRLSKLEAQFVKDELAKPTLEILDKVLALTSYLDQFDELNEEDAARLENIKELRSVAAEFPVLVEFLENIALTEKESKKMNAPLRSDGATEGYARGVVTLMTLHASKGLEFPTVFLVGLEEGLFPHSRALFDGEQMEEERRLCYVGMTRAMDKLYLSYALRRLYFGQRSSNMVSRFLGDIPEMLIQNSQMDGLRKHRGRQNVPEAWGFDENGNWRWQPSGSHGGGKKSGIEDELPF